MGKNIEAKEPILIGDTYYDEDAITPSIYFDYVKGLKQKVNTEEMSLIIDSGLKMLEKCKVTKQTSMASKISHQVDLALRELDASNKGFNIFVNRKDIEKYIDSVEGKSIKIIELSRYTREIPDDVVEKITLADAIFDEMYIIFTDYSLAETKKVAKERRDKDPILFGAFKDDTENDNKIYIEDRLFFIADWVEEKCDLTLEQIVRDVSDKSMKDITYKVEGPSDIESAKSYLESFNKPIEDLQPTTIFEKVKSTVKRGRKPRSKKKPPEEKK